jgi:small ligand-binding sensory domain FIST
MVVQSDSIKFRVKAAGGLGKGETETGERLAEALSREPEDKLFLIFYDSIKNPPTPDSPPMMNASSSLLRGIDRVLEQVVPVVGAGLVGDYDMGPTVQFCGASPESQHAVGVMVSGNVCAYHRIMHGCMPLDGIYRTITCIEGPILRGLDGRPVVETVNEMFGSDEWQKEHPVDFLTIGVNCGDRYATRFQEGDYVNRLIVGVTPDKSGVVMFEPDLAEGTEIQFMVRDTERMTESARENTERLMETLHADKKRPLFGIYIDCAGRAGAYSHRTTEEASEVQKVLNHHNIPFLGFYSGVEIAPLLGKSRGLDWTGVLIILAEDSEIGGKKI